MPKFEKPATARSKFSARGAAPKAGSKSPTHRGYRPDAEGSAAPKKRWTQDDRAARGTAAPRAGAPYGAGRTSAPRTSDDRRPDWSPTSGYDRKRPAGNDRNDRTERPRYGNDRTERPAREGGYRQTERPSGGRPYRPAGERSERPSTERPTTAPSNYQRGVRAERPSYDRPNRDDRPARTERPAYGDRASRTERPAYDRTERPARSERPSYDRADRPARAERPSYGQTDRPARSERLAYGDRPARPSYDRAERPARQSYDRPSYDRAPRRDDRASDGHSARTFEDRRRDSSFYPSRDEKPAFVEDVVLERLEAAVVTAAEDVQGVTFADLGLGGNITRELESQGATTPFPIQAATIPDVLAGRDVLGRGRTGSGKTIAFGAPLVERLMENDGGRKRAMARSPRALILAPTRELALQIDRTVQPIARSVGLFTTQVYGGVPQARQVGALRRGVDIIIGTPGRIEDLVEQGHLDLSQVTITVLDEADHMCDLGFLEPVQRILHETKEGGQKLLFSATLDKGVATLVDEFLVNPSVHEVAGEDQASSTIDHKVLLIEQRDKRAIIEQLAAGDGKTLVFTRTRAFAEELSDMLEDAGIPAVSLHGDLNQSRRTRNLAQLTSGRVNVLVATDVAARGIHVDDISLVIQADAPEEYKTYLHRSGRTGRAGKVGTVVTLINKNRRRKMDELLGRAEIEASITHVAPGDSVLDDLAAL